MDFLKKRKSSCQHTSRVTELENSKLCVQRLWYAASNCDWTAVRLHYTFVWAGGSCDITHAMSGLERNVLLFVHWHVKHDTLPSVCVWNQHKRTCFYTYIDASLFTDVRCVPSLFLPVTSVYAELELISYKWTLCHIVKYMLFMMYGMCSVLHPSRGMQNLQLIQY
jgi:hypothetical protein